MHDRTMRKHDHEGVRQWARLRTCLCGPGELSTNDRKWAAVAFPPMISRAIESDTLKLLAWP
jgi:hypothetical protein